MFASLMALPFELREQILLPIVRAQGTIELQYPLWGDKSVFVPPIAQVCRALREEVLQSFYRANVFVWKIDPEDAELVEPSSFPLAQCDVASKEYGPSGPLISSLPWRFPKTLLNLRHVRLNLYLPPQHNAALWTNKFGCQLASFVKAVDNGQRLRDLKVLIGTLHKVRKFGKPQLDAMGILGQIQVRGIVQVRTLSLDTPGKAVIQELNLEYRMRDAGSSTNRLDHLDADRAGGRHLDWEWEGGVTVE